MPGSRFVGGSWKKKTFCEPPTDKDGPHDATTFTKEKPMTSLHTVYGAFYDPSHVYMLEPDLLFRNNILPVAELSHLTWKLLRVK